MEKIEFKIIDDPGKAKAECHAESAGEEVCKCGIEINDNTWNITSWFTNKKYQHQGIGKQTLKTLLSHCMLTYGMPQHMCYTWNGANQYVMNWLEKEFDAWCTCPIAIQKKMEAEDIWEAHIYELNRDKLFQYFGIEGGN